ncbi:hypothetical protein [Nocardia asiatica]|uniref:hypothetical protein n=1 Tax=Nocardia asiatica TaxID=209252 RepID=UPI0024578A4E|nr:hypothetical protein [Nocardia asiatica]
MAAELNEARRRRVAMWEQGVRLFGLIIAATPPTVIGWALICTVVGDFVGVGLAQRGAIVFALMVQLFAIVVSRRQPPEGRLRAAVRGAFIIAYAAVAVTAAVAVVRGLMGKVENWEIWVAPFYLMFIFCLVALFERCVKPPLTFGGSREDQEDTGGSRRP